MQRSSPVDVGRAMMSWSKHPARRRVTRSSRATASMGGRIVPIVALCIVGSVLLVARASAGHNAEGWLFVHADVALQYTADGGFCDSLETPALCDHESTVYSDSTVVFGVFAGFPGNARLKGVTFGWDYDSALTLIDSGPCGDFELADDSWPAAGAGTAVTWASVQTDEVVPVYWAAAYSTEATSLELIAHPAHGAFFGDDDVPSNLDAVGCLGVLGFNTPGEPCCTPAEVVIQSDEAPSAFPMPANDFITLDREISMSTSAQLVDVSGRVRHAQVVDGRIDVSGFRSGVYWLRLIDGDSVVQVQKVAIAR